jgi:hypothetical protein
MVSLVLRFLIGRAVSWTTALAALSLAALRLASAANMAAAKFPAEEAPGPVVAAGNADVDALAEAGFLPRFFGAVWGGATSWSDFLFLPGRDLVTTYKR